MNLSRVKKAAVAVVGGVAQLVALGVLPERYQLWAVAILAVATAAGVYQARNAPAIRAS